MNEQEKFFRAVLSSVEVIEGHVHMAQIDPEMAAACLITINSVCTRIEKILKAEAAKLDIDLSEEN